jgi:hypothetical protein
MSPVIRWWSKRTLDASHIMTKGGAATNTGRTSLAGAVRQIAAV